MKELRVKGNTTVTEELHHIQMRDNFHSKSDENLTEEHKQDLIESIMFIKVKRYGRVKGRIFADGQKQCKKAENG